YMSTDVLPVQLFVQSYPNTGGKYQINSDTSAAFTAWSSDGKQIFFPFPPKMFVVDVRTEPTFSFGKPTTLPITGFVQPVPGHRNFDIAPDGKHLIGVLPASAASQNTNARPSGQINAVMNWFEELKQRVPAR